MNAPLPENESERLDWLRESRLLDTPPEDAFDDITNLAAQLCGVPIAAVSLIDDERQWFKSIVGLAASETPRDVAFCAHAILQPDVMVVPDAAQDGRFRDNPLVTGDPNIRFYAGAPLVTSEGFALGSLCVIDRSPRLLTDQQKAVLEVLARQVAGRIELRRRVALQEQLLAEKTQLIAEVTRAEEVARQSEEELRAVVDQAMDGIFVFDPDSCRLLKTNLAFRDMLGYSEEEAAALTLYDIVAHPKASIDRNVATLCRDRELCPVERQYLCRDGSVIIAEVRGRVIRHGQGEAFCVLAHDLTGRRREEEARREAEEGYRALFENAAEGIFQTAPDGRYLSANPALAHIYGYSGPEELIACLTDIGSQLYVEPGRRQDLTRLLSEKGSVAGVESQVYRRDGSVGWISESGRAVYDDAGRLLRYEGFVEDITERKRAEEELRGSHLALQETHLALQESQLFARSVAENSASIIFVFDLDTRSNVYSNRDVSEFLGYTSEQVSALGADLLPSIVHPDDLPRLADHFGEFEGAQDGQVVEVEYRTRHASGEWRWVWNREVIFKRHPDGRPRQIVGNVQDITERKLAEEALRLSHERLAESKRRLRLAVTSGGLGTWHLDLSTGEFLETSDAYKAHFGRTPDAGLTTADVLRALHPDDSDRVRRVGQGAISSRRDYHAEYRVFWPDGSLHWIDASGTPTYGEAGEPLRLVGVTQDITERKAQEAERERALREAQDRADRDPLTGLLNHRAFHRRLEEEADRAQREGTTLAVVMLDLDNFKFFNDCYGHVLGDAVLRQVAERLQTACRPYDTVARFGGDEFALLLPGVGEPTRAQVEARLRAEMGGIRFRPDGQATDIPITVSVGAALLSSLALDHHEALRQADERLRRAKTGGEVEAEADRVRASALSQVGGFSMLDALVTAVDNKDRYTRRHSEDVMDYSLMIAQGLGLDKAAQHTVAICALLHDVGKIGIPDAILRKPGKLTDEEFGAIRQHPQMGAAIVSTVPGLEDTLDAVRHHHERWDGGGYPSGLRGEGTPLIARLMAVADAFSAMTTDRPYRQGMEQAKALSILEAGAGTQWDPQCVEAFLNAQQTGLAEGPRRC